MNDDLEAIRRVVEAFERSDWQEIDVRSGALRVHLASAPPAATGPHEDAASAVENEPVSTDPPPDQGFVPTTEAPPADLPPDAHLVTSPSPGIFWRSPEPGAPPFVEVGEMLRSDTTVCIIEVMKLMNHLTAGVAGEVVAVLAENGVAVAKGEPLLAVRLGGHGA